MHISEFALLAGYGLLAIVFLVAASAMAKVPGLLEEVIKQLKIANGEKP